jgi:hypothetical protein
MITEKIKVIPTGIKRTGNGRMTEVKPMLIPIKINQNINWMSMFFFMLLT